MALKSRKRAGAKAPRRRSQHAALPYRMGEVVEVLLVTSRESMRWVIPKGWPMKRLSPSRTAAREALEEAGVTGVVARAPIGAYAYDKRLPAGAVVRCSVDVYPLRVTRERAKWREMGQRTRRWFSVAEAATLVDEPELQALLQAFQPGADQNSN